MMETRHQRLMAILTPLQRVMLDLDVAVTGVPIEQAVTQYHHYPKTVEDWLNEPGGNPEWYLSDGGYSRIIWMPYADNVNDNHLFLTDNSTTKAKARWENALTQRKAALNLLHAELGRLEESSDDDPNTFLTHYRPLPTVRLHTGEVVPKYWRCLDTIWYCGGQDDDDCIREDEIVTVDPSEYESFRFKADELAFNEHASRYGPWNRDDFEPLTLEEIDAMNLKESTERPEFKPGAFGRPKRKDPRYPTDLRYPNDPHAQVVHELGGKLVYAPLPSRAKWNAMLAAYAPGCGSPTPYPGTGGTAPCGSKVEGKLFLCPHCESSNLTTESITSVLCEDGASPFSKQRVKLQYRPYTFGEDWKWFWVLLPEDGRAALANGEADTRAAASVQARLKARQLRMIVDKVEVVFSHKD
jgi:hypothetical protein